MSGSLSTVEASQPDGLIDAAGQVGTKTGQLDAIIADQRRALAEVRASWEGKASQAAVARAEQDLNKQEDLRARLTALQSALQSGGTQLSSARRGVLSVVNPLRATGWQVADDGTATPPPFPPLLKLFAPAFTAVIQRLLALFDEIDQQTAGAVAAATAGPVPQTPPGTLGDARQLPSKDAKPEDVKKWWDSLSQEERDGLIAGHPPELGNLNGIPAEVRDQVNYAVMNDDLGRVTDAASRHGVSPEEVIADPGKYGLTQTDITRYTNAKETFDGLERIRAADEGINRPAMVWAYDPLAFHGQGRAAVAIGNPDQARATPRSSSPAPAAA